MFRILIAFAIALFLISDAWSQTVHIYRVGNSHTVTAAPSGVLTNWHMNSTGELLREGYHIRCGQPLMYMFMNPADTCVAPPYRGFWPNAFTSYDDWNHVVFQPSIPSKLSPSTLGTDIAAIRRWMEMISNAGAKPTFYIMQAPPPDSEAGFSAEWWLPVNGSTIDSTVNAYDYYQHLMERLTTQNPDQPVYLIPTSDIYDDIGNKFKANPLLINGQVFDDHYDLYRDPVHGNSYAGYSSGLAIYASMFPMPREKMDRFLSDNKYGTDEDWTPAMYELIRDSVYDMLNTVPFARTQQ